MEQGRSGPGRRAGLDLHQADGAGAGHCLLVPSTLPVRDRQHEARPKTVMARRLDQQEPGGAAIKRRGAFAGQGRHRRGQRAENDQGRDHGTQTHDGLQRVMPRHPFELHPARLATLSPTPPEREGTSPYTATTKPTSAVTQRWTLIAAALGSSVVFLDSTVVNVALPRIGRELPSHVFGVLEGQSYVYNGYLLTLSALLILAGAASDFYGRRRTFGIGVVAFGLISALCGLAPNMESLAVFRVLQGAAGALLVPGSLSLISAAFSGEEEGRAIGTWSAASAATTLLGPFVGGVLVDTISCRVAVLINVPLALVPLYAVIPDVPESQDPDASGH